MGFWKSIFGSGSKDENNSVSSEISSVIPESPKETNKRMSLDDVRAFITELKSCYLNDSFKNQSEFVSNSQAKEKAQFLRKKLAIEKIAESQLEVLQNEVYDVEKDMRSIWGKANYSFYEELEKKKMAEVEASLFQILLKLPIINVKPELDSIIITRIEKARADWGISTAIPIPENMALKITGFDSTKECYSIGSYDFEISGKDSQKAMISEEQGKKIANLKIDANFSNPGNDILVRCATASRLEIERLSNTAMLHENWRLDSSNSLKFFVVKKEKVEQFLKTILQVILNFDEYVEITLFNMNTEMLEILSPVMEDESKYVVKVSDAIPFVIAERTERYKDNYQICYFHRKRIPEVLKFKKFDEVCSYFK